MEVGFDLTRLFADQSQDGVVAAGVHHGLAVLDRANLEVLQLVLKEKNPQVKVGVGHTELKAEDTLRISVLFLPFVIKTNKQTTPPTKNKTKNKSLFLASPLFLSR